MKAEARRAALLLVTASLVLLFAYQIPTDVFLDFGPNDAPYLKGFREDFEMDGPTLIHWTGRRGEVTLPLLMPGGPLAISFRFKRHAQLPAEIRVFAAGREVDRFVVAAEDFSVRQAILPRNPRPGAPLQISVLAHSADPRPLGLALDWLQVRPLSGWSPVLPTASAFVYLLATVLGLYLFPRLMGFSARASLALGLAGALALSVAASLHKLAPLHATTELGVRPHLLALAAVGFFRWRRRSAQSVFSRPEARWALLAFYLGTTVRLLALFHPEFYYPDVRTHSKFVSLIWTEGLRGFFSNHIENQHRHLLGLQLVGDRWLAFPYPPLLYLSVYPLSRLQLPVDDWMKILPTALAGIEALIVFAVACRLGASGRAAAAAAWIHATAPLLAFRLTVASYAALFGHFWDMLVAMYLLIWFKNMDRPLAGPGLALLVAASLLSYAGSALVLGLFIPAFAAAVALRPREPGDFSRALRVAMWALVGALLAVGAFYIQYLPELAPDWLGDARRVPTSEPLIHLQLTPGSALAMAWHRLLLFYGPLYGPLALAALLSTRRQLPHRLSFPLAFAACFSFLGLNFLRSGLGETNIFQFSKDDLVLLPLAAIVLGGLADRLAEKGRLGKVAASALLGGWVVWGSLALARDVRVQFVRPDYPPQVSSAGTALRPSQNSHAAEARKMAPETSAAGLFRSSSARLPKRGV